MRPVDRLVAVDASLTDTWQTLIDAEKWPSGRHTSARSTSTRLAKSTPTLQQRFDSPQDARCTWPSPSFEPGGSSGGPVDSSDRPCHTTTWPPRLDRGRRSLHHGGHRTNGAIRQRLARTHLQQPAGRRHSAPAGASHSLTSRGQISTVASCAATEHGHPSDDSIASTRAALASGSPWIATTCCGGRSAKPSQSTNSLLSACTLNAGTDSTWAATLTSSPWIRTWSAPDRRAWPRVPPA